MKILHICTFDSGGAGTAARRLHCGLKSIGVESKMLALDRSSSDSSVVKFAQNDNIFRRQWNKIRARLISSEFNAYRGTQPQGLEIFTDDRSIHTISKHPLVREVDAINLHWIANMVDCTEFFANIPDKPIVWTLHDMNPFTGGCHYAGICTKYETGCRACPQLDSKNMNDLSRRIWKRKEKAYKRHDIYIITPSKWLADCAKRSILFKKFNIDVIPYGISTSVFTKRGKQFSRDLLNLPQDKILILFGASYKAGRKGLEYLIQSLKSFKDKVNTSKIDLVIFGNCIDFLPKEIGFSIYLLGHIYDELLLSCVYSAADMFIIPSLEDNLPNTMLEAMACETPVVGFNVGGLPEAIKHEKTGLLTEVRNAKELAEKIKWMINHPKERQEMVQNARKLVEQEYALEVQAKSYYELYKYL